MSDNNASTSQKVQSSTGLIFETRNTESVAISKLLARDILERIPFGGVAIATDRPAALLSSVRKQCLRLTRQLQNARSSTLDHDKKTHIDRKLTLLQTATFTASDPLDDPVANVSFATTLQFLAAPPTCPTLLVTNHTDRLELHMLSSWMPRGGKVIVYG